MPAVRTGKTEYFWNHEGYYYDAMSSVWKNMTVIKLREVLSIIDNFAAETPHGKSPWTKIFWYLIRFVGLEKNPKIKR